METAVIAPITAIYAAVLAFIFIVLSFGVIGKRRKQGIGIGPGKDSQILQAVRVHGNFAEYVPLTLILLFLAEVNQASSLLLYILGAWFTVARVLHAIGLNTSSGTTWQRFVGTLSTFFVMIILSVINLLQAF